MTWWLKEYLMVFKNSENIHAEEISRWVESVKLMMPLSHLYWGTWSLMQVVFEINFLINFQNKLSSTEIIIIILLNRIVFFSNNCTSAYMFYLARSLSSRRPLLMTLGRKFLHNLWAIKYLLGWIINDRFRVCILRSQEDRRIFQTEERNPRSLRKLYSSAQ